MTNQPRKIRKTKTFQVTGVVLIALLILWAAWGNLTVGTTRYKLSDEKIPSSFNNFKIAQISDLHNAEFGKDNAALIDILSAEKPDLIAITGDLADSNHTDLEAAFTFIEQAVKIAPSFYVTGNHDALLRDKFLLLESKLKELGVSILRNQMVMLEKDGYVIQLTGIDDPAFVQNASEPYFPEVSSPNGTPNTGMENGYRILLAHHPEAFETYAAKGFNLILSGHAHGGQFRLPIIGGLIAPDQGFLPKYDAGIYKSNQSAMILSRGIGNSVIPLRFNNRPEVVIIELKNK